MGRKYYCHAVAALAVVFAAAVVVAADRRLSLVVGAAVAPEEVSLLRKVANLMWNGDGNSYQHVWPVITNCLSGFLCFIFFTKEQFVCFYQRSLAGLAVLRRIKFTKLARCCIQILVGPELICCSGFVMKSSLGHADRTDQAILYYNILLNLR